MGFQQDNSTTFRYRGFVLIEQPNQSWLVRPERSPMITLPFRTPFCSIEEAKAIVDMKLSLQETLKQAA